MGALLGTLLGAVLRCFRWQKRSTLMREWMWLSLVKYMRVRTCLGRRVRKGGAGEHQQAAGGGCMPLVDDMPVNSTAYMLIHLQDVK
jgi:hypothetical protein